MKFNIEKHNKALLEVLETEQISQLDLATKIGISKQAISPIYKMKRPLSKRLALYIVNFHPKIALKYSIEVDKSVMSIFNEPLPAYNLNKSRIEQLEETVSNLNKNIEELKAELDKIKGDLKSKGSE